MSTRTAILDLRPPETKTGRRRVADAFLATIAPSKDTPTYLWKDYIHRENGKRYDYHHFDPDKPGRLPCNGTDAGCQNPNHMAEKTAVYSDTPSVVLFKGGEGGGKSVAGIIKDLERLRRGMGGIMVSPDFEHFKKSLWAEFRRWCPLEAVLERERYRLRVDWEPSKQFELHFHNEYGGLTTLYCGGMDDPAGWEGPNVHWYHGDEVRRKDNAHMLKVLSGRARLDGPKNEPPQGWFTTTPKLNWLYDYFGGVPDPFGNLDPGQQHFKKDDPLAEFKSQAVVVSLYTGDNMANLNKDYVRNRGATLTESEKRVYLEAAWEDIGDVSHFLEHIEQWDACEERKGEELGDLGANQPVVLAVDGAYAAKGDVFAAVASQKHPDHDDWCALRDSLTWEAEGKPRDFDQIEDDIKEYCLDHAVTEIVYDPRELHHMMSRLKKRSETVSGREFPGVATVEFPQGPLRAKADKNLRDMILAQKLTHNGDPVLKKHVGNADKVDKDGKGTRIVKRTDSLKIDLCVCASMAAFRAMEVRKKADPPGSHSRSPFRKAGRA